MVRFQRRFSSFRQPSSRLCLYRHEPRSLGRRHHLASSRLATREEVERCWVLFGCYLGESRATVSCSRERESKRERGTSVADRSLFLLSQGLVCITPASGFVGAPAAVAFGFVGGVVCNFATRIKVRENPSTRVEEKARRARRADLYPFLRQFLIHVDDVLDIFATHGVRTRSEPTPCRWRA